MTDSSVAISISNAVLRARDVRFSYDGGATWALDGVNLEVAAGEYVCLVGRNGSGKSTLALLLAGLAAPDGGRIELLGRTVFDEAGAHPEEYREARHGIGMVFQNPEDQIVTTVLADDVAFGPENLGVPQPRIAEQVQSALAAVGMTSRAGRDPTHMSGGQQQRAAIAGMLAMNPRLLILDEPTAMLDADARAGVMRILDALHQRGTTILHVTHHDEEAARATRIIRMEQGRIVQDDAIQGVHESVLSVLNTSIDNDSNPKIVDNAAQPSAQYAQSSAQSVQPIQQSAQPIQEDIAQGSPSQQRGNVRNASPYALEVNDVTYRYGKDQRAVLNRLSFTVQAGETVALVGRNGSGKSTLAKLICALAKPLSGSIRVCGIDTVHARRRERRALRSHVGYVMQHPERQLFADTVYNDVAYGPRNQGLRNADVESRVNGALTLLGIAHLAERSPFELSGGQQRLVAIAGVIACNPDVLVMDEPTSSLDAYARKRIDELIRTLHAQGVTILLITHDPSELALADHILDLSESESDATEQTNSLHVDHPVSEGRSTQSSIIHRLDPRIKMVLTLVLMFSAFAITNGWQLLAGAALTVAVVAASRVSPMKLLASIHMFVALIVIMGALNVFFVRTGTPLAHIGSIPITDDGLKFAAIYSLRFALVIVLGAVFLETTTPTSMTDAFESLLSPLGKLGVHTHELSLVMSLALRFIPTLMGEMKSVVDAQSARGGSIETGSLPQRVRALGAVIVPVFAGTLRHADNLSRALDARSYEGGAGRTHYRIMKAAPRDAVAVAIAIAYVVLIVVV